jgi:hypothetical protein
VEDNAKNVDDIRIPTIIIGPNPYLFAIRDDKDAEKYCVEECTDPIQATLLSVELKSFIIDPKLSPKLLSIPTTIAFAISAEKQIIHERVPYF